MALPTATREQLTERLRLAIAARRERAAILRSDFPPDDEAEWSRLAAKFGVKLPPYGAACATAAMERWLRQLGIPIRAYLGYMGAGMDGNENSHRLSDFPRRNPTWPLKAWVGLVLEALDDGRLEVSAHIP